MKRNAYSDDLLMDDADITSNREINTNEIEERLEKCNGRGMLISLREYYIKYFGFRFNDVITPTSVIRGLKKILTHYVGDFLKTGKSKKIKLNDDDNNDASRKLKNVTTYSLGGHGYLMSYLELANAALNSPHVSSIVVHNPSASVVNQALQTWRPEFHWTALTGIPTPTYDGDEDYTIWNPEDFEHAADKLNKRRHSQQKGSDKRRANAELDAQLERDTSRSATESDSLMDDHLAMDIDR